MHSMINQSNRDEIIKMLDESSESVKLEDLFLFDLSPYYNEKANDSFFNKQLDYQKERYRLKHSKTKHISFATEQKKIYEQILDESNKRLIISAPTSFGKTMLVKEYIYNKQPEKVVFIVPTNSLADELIDDFVEIYTELGYTIYDTVKENSIILNKSIFIGTQEKFYQIYQNRNIELDLFVIDEAYKLGDKLETSREVILNRTFIDTLNSAKQTILLLPLAKEIEGLSRLNFRLLQSEYSPVAKNFITIKDNEFESRIINSISENIDSNLIYFDSPAKAEGFYLDHQSKFLDNKILASEWIERVENDFHPEWIPIKSLKNGIGIHYGPMPKFIQKKVVSLFEREQVKTILATSSIIEGVNTPTKNIYITTSKDILSEKHVVKFKNLIGRAGRLGIHKVGNVYYKNKHQSSFDKANIPFQNIFIEFIIKKDEPVVNINRESEFSAFDPDSTNDNTDTSFSVNRTKTVEGFNKSGLGKVPHEKISEIIDKHGFTINQVQKLIEYVRKNNNVMEHYALFWGILGILKASDKNLHSLKTIINEKYETITEIINALKNKVKKYLEMTDSQLVSVAIKMIYNTIPYKIVPALDFIIELNEAYINFNNEHLFLKENIKEANTIKSRFFNKFIGKDIIQEEEAKKVMIKMFEYGIPYTRAKDHIQLIVSNIPDNFSIFDIKKVIYGSDSMQELRIYFE